MFIIDATHLNTYTCQGVQSNMYHDKEFFNPPERSPSKTCETQKTYNMHTTLVGHSENI